jgi:hypothetical protein
MQIASGVQDTSVFPRVRPRRLSNDADTGHRLSNYGFCVLPISLYPQRMTLTVRGDEERRSAPYVSFTALKKLLARMAVEGGPPGRVDKSYLTGMSGGYQAQLLLALRSLDLIVMDGSPTDDLKRLTADLDGELPAFMQRKVTFLYPEAVELAKTSGTAAQLAEKFKEAFGFTGSTLEGAIRFYLDASQFASMPLSINFRAPKRARKPNARRTAPAKAKGSDDSRDKQDSPKIAPMLSSTQRVELSSGGNLVVTMTVDLFSLSDDDRTFVFDLIDRMKTYKGTVRDDKSSLTDPDNQGGDGE